MGLGRTLTRAAPGARLPMGPSTGPSTGQDTLGVPPAITPLPQPVTEYTAIQIPAFYRGLAYVSGTVGSLPVHAWRDAEQLDPQPPVMRQPDPRTTPMAFWGQVVRSLILYGNSLSIIADVDRLGYPTALRPVNAEAAAVRLQGDPMSPDIGGWFVHGQFYDVTEVWHVRSFIGKAGWPLGMGLIDGAYQGISLAQAVQGYAAGYFAGGAMPPYAVKVGRPELTSDQADTIRADATAKFGGSNRTPAVLNSLTDIVPLANNANDAQLAEARNLTAIDCALLFGLPASKLGATVGGMTYKNAEMEEVQARNDAVSPWCRLLEQSISLELLPRGQYAEWNLDAFLRADTLSRYQGYQLALGGPGTPWMVADEIRAIEGRGPMSEAVEAQGEIPPIGDPQLTNPEAPPVAIIGPGGPDDVNPYTMAPGE